MSDELVIIIKEKDGCQFWDNLGRDMDMVVEFRNMNNMCVYV